MRLIQISSSLLSLTALLLARPVVTALIPDFFQSLDILQPLEKRCTNPCGYYGQLCCASNEYCYTDTNGQAQCGINSSPQATAGGQWQYYTTTYVMTDLQTITTTYSSYIAATPTATTTALNCKYAQGETSCVNVCCITGQYCQSSGVCVAIPGGSSGYYSSLYTVTTIITNTASAAIRPTTQTVLTITSTNSAGRTTVYQTPVSTGGSVLGTTQSSSGGLSGGAIAGIVIGVIAGILILILICACCCFKGLIDGLLGIFGLGGRKRRTEETYIEERHSHRSGAGGVGRRWFGQPGRTEVVEEKKSSGFGRIAGVAALLGALAVGLGLKRRVDRRDEKSEYSGTASYTYDYTSSSKYTH